MLLTIRYILYYDPIEKIEYLDGSLKPITTAKKAWRVGAMLTFKFYNITSLRYAWLIELWLDLPAGRQESRHILFSLIRYEQQLK